MVENGKLKITVLKKTDTNQIFGDNPPMGHAIEACSLFEEGQEFIVGENGGMPEGFCHWAWSDIHKKVITLMYGGSFPWMKEKGTSVSCCTDGLRPVIFELRRIE
ncbi:MAG: TIGR04076 family protein [Candidatus Bathyarchaeota archaeon]|nr:MAG: TIGR04076 family protein [Candidatus Bathyarchaeota archaeon]